MLEFFYKCDNIISYKLKIGDKKWREIRELLEQVLLV